MELYGVTTKVTETSEIRPSQPKKVALRLSNMEEGYLIEKPKPGPFREPGFGLKL